jgi:uncharacterized protein YhdP
MKKKKAIKDALIVIRTKFQGIAETKVQVQKLPVNDKGETEINVKMDLRNVENIEIKPIRRPLMDVSGHIQDAENFVNEKD